MKILLQLYVLVHVACTKLEMYYIIMSISNEESMPEKYGDKAKFGEITYEL